MTDTIICPNCGSEIAVSETLAAQIRQQLRLEFELEARRKDQDLERALEEIRSKRRTLKASRESHGAGSLRSHRRGKSTRLVEEARVKAESPSPSKCATYGPARRGQRTKSSEAQKAELQTPEGTPRAGGAEARAGTDGHSNAGQRTRQRSANKRKQEADEQNRLKEADRDRLIADLRAPDRRTEAKVRARISASRREKSWSLSWRRFSGTSFPQDTIEAVPVGAHGGDILQRVHDQGGLDCGAILWESKRTKNWNDAWLPKLRHDQRAAKAHLAVLASEEMPKGVASFDCIDGVWVTSRQCLIGLAAALRQGMIDIARTKRYLQGRQDKVELLYSYLAGSEFRQRIEGIVEAFMTLRDDLESEKRSMHRLWAKREKQLERATRNTSGMYGDLAGILGAKLPQIANLEIATMAMDSEALVMEPVNGEESFF